MFKRDVIGQLPRVELEEDGVADEGHVGVDAGGRAGAGAQRGHGRRGGGAVAAGDDCGARSRVGK